MPYVDIYTKDDYASIYYTTTAPFNNVSSFDPNKSTIMILHPIFLDSTWLDCQLGDPRLYNNYNLIAFDSRSSGKSTCKPNGKRDSWVDATDIALCHQMLHLPPCHVFALESISVNCALRFALLFPEMCLSLALCNVSAPVEHRWNYNAFEELLRSWSFASDLETLEHSLTEAISLLFGPDCDPDLQDEVSAHWQRTMPPTRRPWSAETASVLLNRTALTRIMFEEITQPVLIIQGERNEMCPRKHAEVLASQLTNSENGAVIYTVKGAGSYLSIIPGSASIVNQVYTKFLSRMPPSRSDIVPPQMPISQRMKEALVRQAGLLGDTKNIADLDPTSPLSFSCLPEEIVQSQYDTLEEYFKHRLLAFNPLGLDGRPLRKLSQGKSEHWFQGGKDGLSVAATSFPTPERGRLDFVEKPPRAEREDRLVKSSAPTVTVEKYYIKGSMVKVVREAPSAPISRILQL